MGELCLNLLYKQGIKYKIRQQRIDIAAVCGCVQGENNFPENKKCVQEKDKYRSAKHCT